MLKAALPGGNLDNSLAGVLLSDAQTKGFVESVPDQDVLINTGTALIDFTNGDFQKVTPLVNSPFTLEFTNWPSQSTGLSPCYAKVRLWIDVLNVLQTITFPPTVLGLGNVTGAVGLTVTPPAAGTYLFEISTSDGGATLLVTELIHPKLPVPTTSGSAGLAGQFVVSGAYIYVCIANNTWTRVQASAW